MENRRIHYYEEIDSTNTEIGRLAAKGAAHGTVVVAERQTAGKGRRGRTWESPAEDNIYLSVLLRPQMDVNKAPMLTIVMAYSVATAIQRAGFESVQIKWPNDLVLSGKKVCGILTEMQLQGSVIDHIVVGVGINVNMKAFPEEISQMATSLYRECGRLLDKRLLIEDILEKFEEMYERFLLEEDLSFVQEEYNQMLVNCGREVVVLEPGNEYTARAIGMNSTGELIVKTAEGKERAIFAGEVSVRGIYGYI